MVRINLAVSQYNTGIGCQAVVDMVDAISLDGVVARTEEERAAYLVRRLSDALMSGTAVTLRLRPVAPK